MFSLLTVGNRNIKQPVSPLHKTYNSTAVIHCITVLVFCSYGLPPMNIFPNMIKATLHEIKKSAQ